MSLMKAVITASQTATRPGFVKNLSAHCMCFLPRSDKLLVTFDHRGSIHSKGGRMPWGFDLAADLGWSHLGNLTKQNDWFRHKELFTAYRRLRKDGFFAGFDEVVFLGASMGGYAACAFSINCPGARVVAFSPQSTLRRDIVPFGTRFKGGRTLGNWSGPWVDGAHVAEHASDVKLFYDPHPLGDAQQAERFKGPHVHRFTAPYMGHKLPREFQAIGQFEQITKAAILDQLSPHHFRQQLRVRRTDPAHAMRVLKRAQKCGHGDLLARVLANGKLPFSQDYIARMGRRLTFG